jgi:hypothetical protein
MEGWIVRGRRPLLPVHRLQGTAKAGSFAVGARERANIEGRIIRGRRPLLPVHRLQEYLSGAMINAR